MQNRKKIWKAPQLSICIFALISAFTTGQGMTETFFEGNYICGIAISLGIQLLLVWLGWKSAKLFSYGDNIAKILLIIAYAFTILWSAGFSFVYVCNHVYSSFHMRDDQSVLTDTYRQNISNLKNWSEEDFEKSLQDITKHIGILQQSASEISSNDGTQNVTLDLNKLKKYYKDNADISSVISGYENIVSGKTISDVSKLSQIINNELTNTRKQIKKIEKNINKENKKLNEADKKITETASEKSHYNTNTTMDHVSEKIIKETQNKKKKIEKNILKLENNKTKIETINQTLESLKTFITAKSSNAQGMLRTKFAEILSELGSTDPNMETIKQYGDEIYKQLTLSMQSDDDTTVYTTLMQNYLLLDTSLKTLEKIRSAQIYCTSDDTETFVKNTEEKINSFPSQTEKEEWQKIWNDKFANLKANLYLLPSASKQDIAENYNHISALQRSLLTELNGIERAKYYLTNEHPFLAWLSLLLALFLDSIPVLLTIIRAHSNVTNFAFQATT